jgi:hypothetical protein
MTELNQITAKYYVKFDKRESLVFRRSQKEIYVTLWNSGWQ